MLNNMELKMAKKAKPILYSYTIPYDDGAAPNPYWGVLTLAICKPVIRRTAEIGDWVVGTGSKQSPIGNIQNSIMQYCWSGYLGCMKKFLFVIFNIKIVNFFRI